MLTSLSCLEVFQAIASIACFKNITHLPLYLFCASFIFYRSSISTLNCFYLGNEMRILVVYFKNFILIELYYFALVSIIPVVFEKLSIQAKQPSFIDPSFCFLEIYFNIAI